MCGGICGPAGEMSEGRCSVCYRPYRQCSCLLDSAARRQTKKKLAPMKKAIMSKDRIENGFEEKYGRPMTKKEKAKKLGQIYHRKTLWQGSYGIRRAYNNPKRRKRQTN